MKECLENALNKFFDDKRVTMAGLCVWFAIVMALFAWLGIFTTNYMQFGPNEHLVYLGMNLNTWSRWGAVFGFVIVSTAVNDVAGDAISPWMQNCICDHKNRYIPYTKSTCLCISQLWAVYCSVMSIASIALVFSQFDLLIVRMIVDLIVNQYTTTRFLRNKVYNTGKYEAWFEELVEELVDEELVDAVVVTDMDTKQEPEQHEPEGLLEKTNLTTNVGIDHCRLPKNNPSGNNVTT
jgi:hypothetical protein